MLQLSAEQYKDFLSHPQLWLLNEIVLDIDMHCRDNILKNIDKVGAVIFQIILILNGKSETIFTDFSSCRLLQ